VDLPALLSFLAASAALTIAPGPDNTFVVATGMARGRRAALATALGMCCGVSVHTAAAALGVSAVLYSSATAFRVLKVAGAAYLLYLAYRTFREGGRVSLPREADGGGGALWPLYRRGFLMNVVNPKVGIFFLAFLPQFVLPGGGSPARQMLLLGAVFMAQGVLLFGAIAWLSGSLGSLLTGRPGAARLFHLLSGVVLACLGVRIALAER
jgi:threonine/homoserine/homoserine lactone efflux protein